MPTSALEGSKVSFLLTLQPSSPNLTHEMLESVGIEADEIVISRDQGQIYIYLHLTHKIRGYTLDACLQTLVSTHGLLINPQRKENSDSTGYTRSICQHTVTDSILQMLAAHEERGDRNFHRWVHPSPETSEGIENRGYKKLKTKLRLHHGGSNAAQKGIYVLRLEHKGAAPKPFLFYVGKATNIAQRIQQHHDGIGAYCVTGEPFTRVEPITQGSADDLESWERNEVLARMFESGIDNVRGWMYTFRTMPVEQKLSAFDQICEKFDRCRKCGRGTHFVRDCQALSADLWTCGMELRPTYGSAVLDPAVHDRLEDAERRISEAARGIADIARAMVGGHGP